MIDHNVERNLVLRIVAGLAKMSSDEVQENSTLVALGFDSLRFISLIVEIERTLDRQLFDIDGVGDLRTVGDLLRLLDPSVSR